MCLALMQPLGNGHYPEGNLLKSKAEPLNTQEVKLRRKAHDIIFLVDASASMSVKDARLGKARLDYAKEIAEEMAANFSGESASLYTFTSEVTQLSPPTFDYLFVRFMLREIIINEGGTSGTNFVTAFTEMRKKFFKKPSPRLKTLVVFSDGGDTTLESSDPSERQKTLSSLFSLISDAEDLQLRIYTIGMGSKEGGKIPDLVYQDHAVHSSLEENFLQKIAKLGRGAYYEANQFTALTLAESLKAELKKDPPYYDEKQSETEIAVQNLLEESSLVYDHYFQIPLGIALLLFSLALFSPDTYARKELSFLYSKIVSDNLLRQEEDKKQTFPAVKDKKQ